MIALRERLPAVVMPDGEACALERRWLVRSVAAAAARAGHCKWWLSGHVAESVLTYLEKEFPAPSIRLAQFEKAVRSVLEVIGFPEVAVEFRLPRPAVRISLAEVARDAGPGYELVFFGLLRERLERALATEAEELEICDAQPGVKLLRAAKNWRRDCASLLEDIVGFVRTHIERAAPARSLHLQLS